MTKKEKIISKILNLANTKYPDSEIYLYGSRARGNYTTMSDWDLLILLNSKNIPFSMVTKLMDEFYEIELETGEVISPLIYSKEEWEQKYVFTPLFANIKKEAIKLK
ncbi:MAG: nucleotidyltransferase domain-containing protein [Bacteroidetes bacterium]|nr:nucleotidyltransferase domain-containing protein [Bacteroidota bacterium]